VHGNSLIAHAKNPEELLNSSGFFYYIFTPLSETEIERKKISTWFSPFYWY
jgi:hypothetical protein